MTTCISCESPVLPSFVHSLRVNSCPSCGGPIFDEKGQGLIEELTQAFEQMGPNPAGIAGWLLTNYRISRIGETPPEPVEFYGQPKPKRAAMQELPDNGNEFLQRAGVNKNKLNAAQSKYRDIVKEIEESQNNLYGSGEEEIELPSNYVPTAEDIAIMQNAMPFGQAKALRSNKIKTAAITPSGPLMSDELEEFKALMEADAEKASQVHPAIEAERMRRLARQEANSAGYGGTQKRIKRAGDDD